MRERARALARPAGGQGPDGLHLPFAGRAPAARRRRAHRPEAQFLDSGQRRRARRQLRDAGACTDNALARRWQWTISLWKNQGLDAAGAEAAAADERRALRGARDAPLPGAPVGFPGGRLRRPDRAAAQAAAARRGQRAPSGSSDSRMSWSTRCRTPMRSSTSCCDSCWASAGCSPRWVTTTRASTAGAARRSRTCAGCRRTTRGSSSSRWSRTTAPPAISCALPMP